MFPLGMVLLPGTAVPLHIFEPRYVAMVRDLLAADDQLPEFGVVMIERGFEVGGGDVRADVGTLAVATGIQATPQGGYVLMAAGRVRIRVIEWLADDPYPRAETEVWRDIAPLPDHAADAIHALLVKVSEVVAIATEVGMTGASAPSIDELSDDPQLALYQLAGAAPIGPVDRFKILSAPTFAARVDVVGSALDDAAAVLEFRRS